MTPPAPLSPGEQPRSQPANPRRLRRLLLAGAAIVALVLLQRDHLNEYLRYWAEDREPLVLDFRTLSVDWTERTVEERFAGHRVRCVPYQGPLPVQRACSVDAGATNGVPVLYMAFFFAHGQLDQMIVNIPWWVHGGARDMLTNALGQPMPTTHTLFRRRLLHRWSLPDGAAVFFNRTRSLNPLTWNSIYWVSPAACLKTDCALQAPHSRDTAALTTHFVQR